jgi:hypothetical protein
MAGEAVQRWRKNTKRKAVMAFGGSCSICGYRRCPEAFDFHHLDPSKKDFSIASAIESPISATVIANELEKCVLLCANCHRELHAGLIDNSMLKGAFDREKFLHKDVLIPMTHACAICGKDTTIKNITCSSKCSGKRLGKIEWDNVDLPNLIKVHKTWVGIARTLGVSDVAVKKYCLKIGLKLPTKLT